MNSTTNKLTSGLTIAVLALALSVGVSYVIAATYSEPSAGCTPTAAGCNVDAPINVGGNLQTKLGALQVNWTPSGFAQIGLQLNGKIQINDAGPNVNTVGAVLTNEGNGVGSWAPASSGGSASLSSLCNTVITPPATTGYTPISLLVGGKNICSDSNGCTYSVWKYSNTSGAPEIFAGDAWYGEGSVQLQQNATTHRWSDSRNNTTGINGDSTATTIFDWDNHFFLNDDKIGSGSESSPDTLTIYQDSLTYGYVTTICDL